MKTLTIAVVTIIIAMGSAARGEMGSESAPPAENMPPAGQDASESASNWLEWAKMTGDWGGVRTDLDNKGVKFDIDLTQIYQGVISGGRKKQGRYGGLLDMAVTLDTGKMGLWKGGQFYVRTQAQFGEFANLDTGQLIAANLSGWLPTAGQHEIAIVGVRYTQFVAPWLAFFGGKLDTPDGDGCHLAGARGKDQFLNTNFVLNPVTFTTVPIAALGFGTVVVLPDPWKRDKVYTTLTYTLIDTNQRATKMPFKDAFDKGVTNNWELRVPTNFLDLPGSQMAGFLYSTHDRTAIDQNPRLLLRNLLLGLPVVLEKADDSWVFYYNFHQYLWVKPSAKRESAGVEPATPLLQGIGVFGRFGCADPKTNPIQQFYSIGLGGRGLIPTRENDTFGAGFFCSKLSDELGPILSDRTRDPYGVEVFYNFEVTPWLHITADLQVLEPAVKTIDTAVVAGLRAKIDF